MDVLVCSRSAEPAGRASRAPPTHRARAVPPRLPPYLPPCLPSRPSPRLPRRPPRAAEPLSAALTLVSRAEALIVDLRGNRGGDPDTVAFVCGYLLDGGVATRPGPTAGADVCRQWATAFPGRPSDLHVDQGERACAERALRKRPENVRPPGLSEGGSAPTVPSQHLVWERSHQVCGSSLAVRARGRLPLEGGFTRPSPRRTANDPSPRRLTEYAHPVPTSPSMRRVAPARAPAAFHAGQT